MDAQKIGNAIKTLRRQRGLTQSQLAYYLGVTDKAVSKWERGIGIPDITTVTALASLLYVDVDNLLNGNISYLEENWTGVLILEDASFPKAVYGKPSVYFSLCYFLLVGIRTITVFCPEDCMAALKSQLGSGAQLGITLLYQSLTSDAFFSTDHTMVIYGTPFLYGVNLTRCFQNALADKSSASVLSIPYLTDVGIGRIAFDGRNIAQLPDEDLESQPLLPIAFFRTAFQTCRCTKSAVNSLLSQLIPLQKVRVIPMGNGMIYRELDCENAILEVANLVHLLETFSGTQVYDPKDIARARGMIPQSGKQFR